MNIFNTIANNMKYGSYDEMVKRFEAEEEESNNIIVSLIDDVLEAEEEVELLRARVEHLEHELDIEQKKVELLVDELDIELERVNLYELLITHFAEINITVSQKQK